MSVALDKPAHVIKPETSDKMLHKLLIYLLEELEAEIGKGNKWADEVRYRAFKRLEVEQ